MENFIQQVSSGLAMGCIYACFALSVVMTFRVSRIINFAQGEVAAAAAYVAWSLLEAGAGYWVAFSVAVAAAAVVSALIERVFISRVAEHSDMAAITVTIGVMLILSSLLGWYYGHDSHAVPSPFKMDSVYLSFIGLTGHDFGALIITTLMVVGLYLYLNYTRHGLLVRAVAADRTSARYLGVRVLHVAAAGWGIAGALCAVSGLLIAPSVFLSPHMMSGVLIYGFAAAILGGITSPVGAIVGGLLVGVFENLAGSFLPFVGTQLKLPFALFLIIVVLMFKPQGLLGKIRVERV